MEYRNVLTYAFRALKVSRLCSVISILGLGIGLACMIVIAKYIWQEYTTDHFHENFHQMYFITSRSSDVDVSRLSSVINFKEKISDFPEVEARTAIGMLENENLIVGGEVVNADVLFSTPDIFRVFSFPLLAGDTATVLRGETDMVITEHFAQKVFGHQDPLGKEIPFWNEVYRVTGILRDLPVNSSFSFDVLILDRSDFSRSMTECLVLKKNMNIQSVLDRLTEDKFMKTFQYFVYGAVAFDKLYFDRSTDVSLVSTMHQGNKQSLGILLIAGIIILLISIVNYVNIYQVALLKRDKELGVKRVHGLDNLNLWIGFWLENLIIVVAAIGIAGLLTGVCSGWIENELNIPLRINWGFDLLLCLGIILVLPALTSLWPWWKYSRIHPGMVMKSNGSGRRALSIRRILLGVQYVMTMIMLIVSIYFIRQLYFMLHQDLGIKQENIIHAMLFREPKVNFGWSEDEAERAATAKKMHNILDLHSRKMDLVINEIRQWPYVQHVSFGNSFFDASLMPWKLDNSTSEYISCSLSTVDAAYPELYGLELKEGRFFDSEKDKPRENKVVLNETAMKQLGIKSIEEETLACSYWGSGWRIIGVVKDFRFNHISSPILPLVMVYFGDKGDMPVQMHITEGREKETISFLKSLYAKMDTPGELQCHFFKEEVEELYSKDKKIVMTATLFTLLAVLISTIGLFGFSFFDARQRYREIGIRKVNGATTGEILYLLIRSFLLLISLAFVIAVPVAWLIIQRYREGYTESASLAGWLFVVALLFTGLVAFATLLWQSRKAANTNPAEALKND